ncbi:MAG: hypothetical protein ACO2ZW_10235, partial [Burkholderiaceae bacterium]
MSTGMMKIGVCGVGTVGMATLNILRGQADSIASRAGRSLSVTHVGARTQYSEHDYGAAQVSQDVMDVARD